MQDAKRSKEEDFCFSFCFLSVFSLSKILVGNAVGMDMFAEKGRVQI
jgi:hypothetical protein